MPERVRLEKTKSKSKSMTLASARWTLFDQPQLLGGEDAATYHELLPGADHRPSTHRPAR